MYIMIVSREEVYHTESSNKQIKKMIRSCGNNHVLPALHPPHVS